MKETWTKGPWWVEVGNGDDDDGFLYIAHEGTESPDTTVCTFEGDGLHDKANAHLIAAAPEMYEALQLALALVKMSSSYRSQDIADMCNAALKKARGES